jgi:two-component system CheB/CheR fusion protein
MPNSIPLIDDIQNYAKNIVDTVREPLLILDATLRVRTANRAFYQTFHVSPTGRRNAREGRRAEFASTASSGCR